MSVPSFPVRSEDAVKSDSAGIAGATEVKNIVTISQSDYDSLAVKDAQTLYIITS